MVEGLEVVITYRGANHHHVPTPTTSSAAFAALKKDLAYLRVHSPSHKNVRRVNGSFILHWPTAGTSPKVEGVADSLHTRWFKLCSNDPEALKLREFLSIESITMTQDGVLICSTAGPERGSQDVPSGTLVERLGQPMAETAQQPAPASTPASSSSKVQPPRPIPPPRVPPTAPRSDRQLHHLKRRMSSAEGSSSPTRQKLDVPDAPSAVPLRRINTQLQQTRPPTPRVDQQEVPSTPGDAAKAVAQPTREEATPSTHASASTSAPGTTLPIPPELTTIPLEPSQELGEMTPPQIATPVSGLSPLGSGSGTGVGSGPGLGPRPPASPRPKLSASAPAPPSPRPSSSSSGSGDVLHRRDRDVVRLTRELWDTRRQLTAMQAREQVILDDLERLGARPDNRSAQSGVSREELSRSEADLRAERAQRIRAEQALSDVERECRAPFVVPALFQAFMSISELSN